MLFIIVCFLLGQSTLAIGAAVIPGDARSEEYLPLLAGKRVALFCNHTAKIGEEHLLDLLLKDGQQVTATPLSPLRKICQNSMCWSLIFRMWG